MPEHDLDLELLRQIAGQPAAGPCGPAARLGVRVGKVNDCLPALVGKGWGKAGNVRRSDNKWALAYLPTPRRASATMRPAHAFLARKEHKFERLQGEIASLRSELNIEPPDA